MRKYTSWSIYVCFFNFLAKQLSELAGKTPATKNIQMGKSKRSFYCLHVLGNHHINVD